MEIIILIFILFLCFGVGYIITYDDRQKYKLKKLKAVKRDELDELKSQIANIEQTMENNKRTLDYILQFVHEQEQKQLKQL